jgi:hypothetical protein
MFTSDKALDQIQLDDYYATVKVKNRLRPSILHCYSWFYIAMRLAHVPSEAHN